MRFCAIYNLALGLLHIVFLPLWRTRENWPRLPATTQAVLDIFNIQIAVVFLMVAWAYWFHGTEMRRTPLGRVLAVGMCVFWVARLLDDFLFGFQPGWLLFFFVGVFSHAAALIKRDETAREAHA